jgi:hypothetical protein
MRGSHIAASRNVALYFGVIAGAPGFVEANGFFGFLVP